MFGGFPIVVDAVEGVEAPGVGLACKNHAFELRIGEQVLGDNALGKRGVVVGHGMGDGGHGGGLHQWCRVRLGVLDVDGARGPELIGTGAGGGGFAGAVICVRGDHVVGKG